MALTRGQRAKAALIAGVGYPLIAALGSTLKWRAEGLEHLDAIEQSGRPPVLAFWHGRILPATWYFRGRGIVVITSENFDGEWIARIIERFGYGTARGSTSRGGHKALLQLRRDRAAGRAAGFTVDGPRGPARRAQAGAVWLAGATGNPLVPFHCEAARHWTTRSWDRTQIPRPFTNIALAIGAPIDVPAEAHADVLEAKRVQLEESLYALEERASTLLKPLDARAREGEGG
ncbi:MAG: lysophospholipid acyltransferase family protein [Acidobacteriota bacterium]